ncbi:Fe-S cluster assembly ATPase SufC [bacterium]|nr:Fe-S cluster assembly ATPase SufC [bacterium]
MLSIKDLHVEVDGKEVLKGLSLNIKAGEIHAIMGPNGSGKSTLSKVIAGHPSYQITKGTVEFEINFKMKNLLELSPEERAREGVFLAYQYPIEIPGVSNFDFLKTAFNSLAKQQGFAAMNDDEFAVFLKRKVDIVKMSESFMSRPVNLGFSGGEKKKNEIIQMAVLSPRLAFLDETDSGLDIDALKVVADGVNQLRTKNNAFVVVTHYQRLLNYIVPDHVHVLAGGKIIKSGGKELALQLESKGYEGIV